jgi:hypothetical protein
MKRCEKEEEIERRLSRREGSNHPRKELGPIDGNKDSR